jgi:hypothetical protein
MRTAILGRSEPHRDELLDKAQQHRMAVLPEGYEGCPLHALRTYLRNNWRYMRFQEMEDRGLPTVSARARAQVRDRTKERFSVAGAWNLETSKARPRCAP